MNRTVLITLIGLVFAGCSSTGFNRGELKKQIGVKNLQINDSDIKKVLKRKANLPKPFKLGVYFKEPTNNQRGSNHWRWSEKDKEIFSSLTKKLIEDGLVSKVFPIISSIVKDESLKSIRIAAAKHGADSVLVIDGVSDIDRYINSWGWTYALLLPTLFVPGSEVDGLFISSASLWDVRNEFLYITTESEGDYHENYIAAFGSKNNEVIDEAKKNALTKLSKNLSNMINGL